jgi:hypothetical protein
MRGRTLIGNVDSDPRVEAGYFRYPFDHSGCADGDPGLFEE